MLNLALAVGEILQNSGLDVEYTRTTDVYESPFQKAMEANNAGVDYFVSLHRNSFPTANTATGVESLVYNDSGIKYRMAENINEALEEVGFKNLGVKERPNLIVLKRTKMPAVLVEVGFINNDKDNELFDAKFQDIAQAIADGILETLNVGTMSSTNTIYDEFSQEEPPAPEDLFPRGDSPARNNRPETFPQGETYHVQTGAFRNETYARRLLDELLSQDYPAFIDDSSIYYRVRVGTFDNLEDAVQMERNLKRAGYATVLIADPS